MVKLDIISCFYREVLNSNLSRPTILLLTFYKFDSYS